VNHADITKLTRQEANEIYRENYWKPSRADKMQWGLCLVHYDCAVNSGVGGAAKMLQRSLNELAGSEVARVDGIIGPDSLTAIGRVDVDALTRKYLEVREAFYYALVSRDPGQSGFLTGWLNRVNGLRKEVGVDG
jgi:lysozyme family protein